MINPKENKMNKNSTLQENGSFANPRSIASRTAAIGFVILYFSISAVFAQNNSGPQIAKGSCKCIATGNEFSVSYINGVNNLQSK